MLGLWYIKVGGCWGQGLVITTSSPLHVAGATLRTLGLGSHRDPARDRFWEQACGFLEAGRALAAGWEVVASVAWPSSCPRPPLFPLPHPKYNLAQGEFEPEQLSWDNLEELGVPDPPPPPGHRAQPPQGPATSLLCPGFRSHWCADPCCFVLCASSQGPYSGKLWGQLPQPQAGGASLIHKACSLTCL